MIKNFIIKHAKTEKERTSLINDFLKSEKQPVDNPPYENLKQNVENYTTLYLPGLMNRSRQAAMLTTNLNAKDAENLTHVPSSSISWGRKEINEGRFYPKEVCNFHSLFDFQIRFPSLAFCPDNLCRLPQRKDLVCEICSATITGQIRVALRSAFTLWDLPWILWKKISGSGRANAHACEIFAK